LARALAQSLGCSYVELDALFHQPGWTELSQDEFRARVEGAAKDEAWVIDGNYSVVGDVIWERADTVIWFDLSFLVVMSRVIRRTIRRMLFRTELWNGNREPFLNLISFDPQKSIIVWTATRHGAYRRRYAAAQADPQWAAMTFIRLDTRAAVRRSMKEISMGSVRGGVV
jgi:adenylate kinase family enzyme